MIGAVGPKPRNSDFLFYFSLPFYLVKFHLSFKLSLAREHLGCVVFFLSHCLARKDLALSLGFPIDIFPPQFNCFVLHSLQYLIGYGLFHITL
jgi:hypothetical protein